MIRLIAALDSSYGIGKAGEQPWDIPDDLKYFAVMTKQYGGRILYGNKTFQTFNKPLLGRINYLATTNPHNVDGVTLVPDAKSFLGNQTEDLWVIGGASLYELAMNLGLADMLFITHIAANLDCDTFFPEFLDKFVQVSEGPKKTQNRYRYRQNIYHKKNISGMC